MQRVRLFGFVLALLTLSEPLIISSAAQSETTAFVYERQRALIQMVFAEIEDSSPEQQLASLRLAAQLLSPNADGESLGAEDVVGLDALAILERIAETSESELSGVASALHSQIVSELNVSGATTSARNIEISDARAAVLGDDEYDSWLAINLEEGLEYRAQSFDCSVVGLVALAGDGQTVLAGGTSARSRFGFISPITGPAYLRVRAPLCRDGGDIAVSAGLPVIEVGEAGSALSAWPIETGRSYAATTTTQSEQWFRFPAQAGERYVIEAMPQTGELDTYITVYRPEGLTILGEDDDSGLGLGSRLDLSADRDEELLIRIHQLGDVGGRYDMTVSSWQSRLDDALPLTVGTAGVGRLALDSEDWWRIEVTGGQRYRIDVTPSDALDTYLTLYASDGETVLGEDDDGGVGLGSRLEFVRQVDDTLLVRVGRLDRDIGSYDLVLSERVEPRAVAAPAVPGSSYRAVLEGDDERWWSLVLPTGRYVLEARPIAGLDTVMTLYDADGVIEQDSDDDGGEDLGSRLEVRTESETRFLVKVSAYTGSSGEFEFSVREESAAAESATLLIPGTPQQSSLTSGGDQWWVLETRVGNRYTIESIPLADLDTVMTIYDRSGRTVLGSDDDGGEGLGSRLEYVPDSNQPILIRIEGYGDSAGDFEIVAAETDEPLILPIR